MTYLISYISYLLVCSFCESSCELIRWNNKNRWTSEFHEMSYCKARTRNRNLINIHKKFTGPNTEHSGPKRINYMSSLRTHIVNSQGYVPNVQKVTGFNINWNSLMFLSIAELFTWGASLDKVWFMGRKFNICDTCFKLWVSWHVLHYLFFCVLEYKTIRFFIKNKLAFCWVENWYTHV